MKTIVINKKQEKLIRESIERENVVNKITDKIKNDVATDNTPISNLNIPVSLNKKIIEQLLVDGYNDAKNNFKDDIESVPVKEIINKLNKLVAICKKKEEPIHNELEKLCVDIAASYFTDYSDVTLECRLVNDLTQNDFHVEAQRLDNTYEDIQQYHDDEISVNNRKFTNILSMGGALSLYDKLQSSFVSELFKLDEDLPHLYSKILKINEYLMFVDDIDITDKNTCQSGCVKVMMNDDNVEIISVGTLFPFLLIETFRGYLELMSNVMLPENWEESELVLDRADVLKDEPWYMMIGKQLWKKIIGDRDIDASILKELYSLDKVEFNNFISEVLANTKVGTSQLGKLIDRAQYNFDYSEFEKDLEKKREKENLISDNMFGDSGLISESIDEATYPDTFNMEEFKNLRNFAERVRYCKSRLKYLGKGTSRIVFQIDNGTVLKLAYSQKGIAQNEAEASVKNDYVLSGYNFLPEVYDVDENYLWIEMQLARRAKASDFKRLTGFDFKTLCYWITYCWNKSVAYRNERRFIPDEYRVLFNSDKWRDVLEYSIFSELEDYIGNYDVQGIGDLQRISSWGVTVNKNNEEELVLIDNGLSNDVLDKYYK